MRNNNLKTKNISKSKKNRLKADFSKEVGEVRKCNYCKSYMAWSGICAVGNKVDSKYTCYRFTIKAGKDKEYGEYLKSLKK